MVSDRVVNEVLSNTIITQLQRQDFFCFDTTVSPGEMKTDMGVEYITYFEMQRKTIVTQLLYNSVCWINNQYCLMFLKTTSFCVVFTTGVKNRNSNK